MCLLIALAALPLLLCALPAHTALGSAGRVALGAMEMLLADPALPPVSFSLREEAAGDEPLTPRHPRLLDKIRAWQIQVFDSRGEKVSFLQGRGEPPVGDIPWAGLSAGGAPLPDGFYKARFVWQGWDMKTRTSPPVSVSLMTPLELRRLAASRLRFAYTEEGLVVTFGESAVFDAGSSAIRDLALPGLKDLSAFLLTCRGNRVIVRGHTDSLGSAAANLELSRERAMSICRYLAANGVPAGRLSYYGLGSSRPAASNATAEGRAMNRRVDVVVLKS